LLLLGSELAQRLPDELLEGGNGIRDFHESALGITLAEAEASEGLKGFRSHVGNSGAHDAAVRRAVSVEEMRRGSRARDDEPALMNGAVMGPAERDEILGVVVAAF